MAFTFIDMCSLATAVAAGNVISQKVLENQKEILGFLSAAASSISLATSTAFATEPALCFAAACAITPVVLNAVWVTLVKPSKLDATLAISPIGFYFNSLVYFFADKDYKAGFGYLAAATALSAVPVMAFLGVNNSSPALVGVSAGLAILQFFGGLGYCVAAVTDLS